MRYTFLALVSLLFYSCASQSPKINGVSFVASPQKIDTKHVTPLVNLNANWAAVMPFGYIKSLNTPKVIFNIERQWWGERYEGAKQTITLLQNQGISVMLKPQIWVWHGAFTGNIDMETEEDWQLLERTYADFILLYAKLAEEMQIPLLCIGTELHTFVQKRPQFWEELITQIRKQYTGKLTYAENWDQINNVPFWQDLDYIGIDAYFPLSEGKSPKVEELRLSWQKHKVAISELNKKTKTPILFTEYGYRSIDYNAKKPWDTKRTPNNTNMEAQTNALIAIYEEFWQEDWFAGGFLWKWFHNHTESGGTLDNRFTIQNKPAQNITKKYYAQ